VPGWPGKPRVPQRGGYVCGGKRVERGRGDGQSFKSNVTTNSEGTTKG